MNRLETALQRLDEHVAAHQAWLAVPVTEREDPQPRLHGRRSDLEAEVIAAARELASPANEEERVQRITQLLLQAFSGAFSAKLPQGLFDLAVGRS